MTPHKIRTNKTQEETKYVTLIGTQIKQNTTTITYISTLIVSQPVARILINKTISFTNY
jgi:hypothetical protein